MNWFQKQISCQSQQITRDAYNKVVFCFPEEACKTHIYPLYKITYINMKKLDLTYKIDKN